MTKTVIIYGPTVTGKTALAISLAQKYNGEIISADSRQVYQSLDIGTGKVSIQQLNNSTIKQFKGFWIVDGIKIHGFDLANPGEPFSVADFLKSTHSSMIQIIKLKKLPIIVGGTGFYIKVLIDGIDSIGVPKDQKLRQQLEKLSAEKLYQKLLKLDPKRAKSMNQSDRANPRRLIRAIEIALHKEYLVSGIKYQVNTKYSIQNTKYLVIGLTAPNHYLYQRADHWLQTRLEKGLIEEVKNLLENKVSAHWLDNLGLEYRWLFRYLKGSVKKDEAIERLKGDIHSFIRRQKTWFKKFRGINLFDISKPDWQEQLEKKVKSCYTETQ